MNRTRASILVAALSMTSGMSAAFAQDSNIFTGGPSAPYTFASGQEFALELRFGRYVPAVDSEFKLGDGVEGPYEYVFGTGNRFLVGAEFDWQAFRIPYVGTFGPGIGFGYTRSSAKARLLKDPTGPRSGDTTSLTILPMYLVGVLRVDALWNEFGIPVAPYGKVGIGWGVWWSAVDGDTSSIGIAGTDRTRKAQGTSLGWQYALGGALLLDFFDEGTAQEMDAEVGINHSYLFGEWYVSHLDGLGIFKHQMDIGTNTWMVGLMFEF